jgi:hypothetical protein
MVRITALIFDCPAFRTGSEFFSSDRLYCVSPVWQSSQELFPVVAERRITPKSPHWVVGPRGLSMFLAHSVAAVKNRGAKTVEPQTALLR